jgi:hypothetical protein
MRADSENLVAAARQENLLAAGVADEHGAIGKLVEGNALREVGADRLFALLFHCPAFLGSCRLSTI